MNRMCKLLNEPHWMQFGPVTHFDAVRQFVKDRGLTPNRVYAVQTKDLDDPNEPVSTLEIIPRIAVEFLNPRQGADHGEEETESSTLLHESGCD